VSLVQTGGFVGKAQSYIRGTVTDRFWAKVERGEDCWIWLGATDKKTKYGHFNDNTRTWLVHRWAYTETNGAISPNMVVDHICRNRLCVRPAHLEAVSHHENTYRSLVANGLDIVNSNAISGPKAPCEEHVCKWCGAAW
jgi:hypothetical protein